MELIAGIKVGTETGHVNCGGARLTPNAGLRLAEALVRASFRAAISQEVDATAPQPDAAARHFQKRGE
jgi:hypothetical protein